MLKIIMFLAAWLAASAALADGNTLHNARLSFTFGSSINHYTTKNADRVDVITWIDSAGATISNYVAEAEPECNDPLEFFGESYGNTLPGYSPFAIVHGVSTSWTSSGAMSAHVKLTSLTACGQKLGANTTSQYALFSQAGLVNVLRIRRGFRFRAGVGPGDLRPYVARVPVATYPDTVYLDSAGKLQTVNSFNCQNPCVVTDWNGKWMAQEDGKRNGIVMFRTSRDTAPAEITVDADGYSNSNASAITLIQPSGGWSGQLTEVEFLCFYDSTSWSAADRLKNVPPAGCTGIPK